MAKSPDEMTPYERIAEIGSILAAGVLRFKSKKIRKSNNLRDLSLDSSGNQSVHADTRQKERKTHE